LSRMLESSESNIADASVKFTTCSMTAIHCHENRQLSCFGSVAFFLI
jgi:hypothetical protein